MPLWRCPHCATPQPESARCWLCRRSTTTCAACRHYRHGVAGGLGLCGLDPRHLALRGTEVRPCWEAAPAEPEPGPPPADGGRAPAAWQLVGGSGRRPARTFVPVEDVRGRPDGPGVVAAHEAAEAAPPARAAARPGTQAAVTGWSLWGEPDA